MKRLVKQINRRGFTLLETLCATFILVVVSTMLINGFVATMGYSYQTSVYNKSGAKNYAACMNEITVWNHTENCTLPDESDPTKTVKGREELGKEGHAKGKVLTFDSGKSAQFESLNVFIKEYKDINLTVPNEVKGREFAPTNNELADNRKAIVYYPERWADNSNGNLGRIIVMIDETDSKNRKYYWAVGYVEEDGEIKKINDYSKYIDEDNRDAYLFQEIVTKTKKDT